MSDRSFLTWLFFEDKHRALALELKNWVETELAEYSSAPADVDLVCRELVLKLSKASWLDYYVANKYGGINPNLDV